MGADDAKAPLHTRSASNLILGLGGLTVDVGMCGGAGWKIVLGDWDRTDGWM